MSLPEIPDEATAYAANAVAHGNQIANYDCADRALRAAWPYLYAAALRHAADELLEGSSDADLEVTALRRMADEAEAS